MAAVLSARNLRVVLAAVCLLFAAAGVSELPAWGDTAGVPDVLVRPQPPRYFGLYFQGRKVGWMRLVRATPQPGFLDLETATEFTLIVAGVRTEMRTVETRRYDLTTGKLFELTYEMSGTTGSTRIRGTAEGDGIRLVTETGGRREEQKATTSGETLADVLAVEAAILSGKKIEGTEIETRAFDPSIRKELTTKHRLGGVERRLVHGVPQIVRRVDAEVVGLNLPIVAWFGEDGEMLETLLAGFLKARWEDETQAKSGFSVADFLDTSKAPVPTPLSGTEKASRMVVVFAGVPQDLAVDDQRQTWTTRPDGTRTLDVKRDAFDPKISPKLAAIDKQAFAKELAAETHLQIDDPRLRAKAAELVRGAATTGEAAKRILDWVYANVKKTYTPTFSNAAEAMQSLAGDCGEHAVLFVALCRAAGIPARETAGIVYAEEMEGFAFHAWAEVWAGRWVSADPSWGQMPVDPTHVVFARGGMAEQVRIIPLIGALRVREIRVEK
ncbi:MAG: transglutaminase domain-containing protein [Myxococcales bacterium]|nr:MAG: transglutaminase domain-containing protein [Myxococcales bacterium]